MAQHWARWFTAPNRLPWQKTCYLVLFSSLHVVLRAWHEDWSGQSHYVCALEHFHAEAGDAAVSEEVAAADDAGTLAFRALRDLEQGSQVKLLDAQDTAHETQPPPRYTEAALVRTLEELGIGRPSTYATIISTLMDRCGALLCQ